MARSRNAGNPAAGRRDLRDPGERGGGEDRDPQAAVGGEALLRGEVVGVGLGDVDRQAARARGGVDGDERVGVGSGDPLDRGHHAGGGLVVRPRVEVDAGLGHGDRAAARVGLDHGRVAQVRGELRGLGELRGELTEAQVLAALADQAERRDVPERGRAAVAEHHLVAVGQLEQVGDALLHPGHQVLHRRLAVRGAEQLGALGRERGDGLRADLGRSGAEAAVGGLELCRKNDVAGHQRFPSSSGST